MIDVYPVKFEAVDNEMRETVFTVETFDESAATVDIKTVLNVSLWDEISPLIRQCLVDMNLDGDDVSPPTGIHLEGKRVKIEWKDIRHDWPYFRVLCTVGEEVQLQGVDYPDGSAKHDGDVFWTDMGEIKSMVVV